MIPPRVLAAALALVATLYPVPATLVQGITTGAIAGTVTDEAGRPRNALDPAEIQYRTVGTRTALQQVSPLSANSNVPLVTHVGYSSTDPSTAVPIVQFTPPQGGEYVVGNFVNNFWRTQLSVRYSF